jgi:hypothetical protein
MKAIEISGLWWVVRDSTATKRGFVVIDGPYPEEWQAVSACRVNETW